MTFAPMIHIVITTFLLIVQTGFCAPKYSDLWDDTGKAKIKKRDQTLEQKISSYEIQREGASYMLQNIGKRCSELENIPEYVRKKIISRKNNQNDTCFPNSDLQMIYKTLGDYEKAFEEKRKSRETEKDKHDPYKMHDWLYALIDHGLYHEALDFFPEVVSADYPNIRRDEVIGRLQKDERIPEYLSQTNLAEAWDKVLAIRNKSDEKPESIDDRITDVPLRMQHYFYSNDDKKRNEALNFYKNNKIVFMIEKAQNEWKGPLKNIADLYLQELKATTTTQ